MISNGVYADNPRLEKWNGQICKFCHNQMWVYGDVDYHCTKADGHTNSFLINLVHTILSQRFISFCGLKLKEEEDFFLTFPSENGNSSGSNQSKVVETK